jgi:hypothetical protein
MTDLVSAAVVRLRELKEGGTLTTVDGLAALASLVKPPVDKMPAAYVLPADERYPLTNGLINGVRQLGSQSVSVVLLVAARSALGDGVFDPIATLRDAVRLKLLGWQPESAHGALLYAGGKLLDVQPTHIAWQMNFSRDHTVRA